MRLAYPHRPRRVTPPRHAALALVIALSLHAASAHAAPQPGYHESFPGIGVAGWGGGTPLSNPGTGGVHGAGDGFLMLSQALPGHFGANASTPPYTGDWTAAGITKVTLWLSNLGTADDLEIHFMLGFGDALTGSYWQYNPGFIPPTNGWGMFTVDLTAPAQFTEVIGTATFANTLAGITKIHVRSDKAPFTQVPDPAAGDLGLDELFLYAPGAAAVEPAAGAAVARPVELAPPAPNPSRGPVAMAMRTWDPGPVRMVVVDAAGRVIRRAELAGGAAGSRSWTWDGADDSGRPVAPGVYRVRAIGAAGGTSRSLVRVL